MSFPCTARFRPLAGLAATLAILNTSFAAGAAEVVLKVHHQLPPSSGTHKNFIEPWCAKIKAESAGRIECQIYPAMTLGGTPAQLYDQVRDGVADVVWTIPSYQANRFPLTEVFDLPFITVDGERSSRVAWDVLTRRARDEYKQVHPLAFHVHDGAQLHTNGRQVRTLADLKGMKIRTPTRLGTRLLSALGAVPIGMPVPQVTEALSRGVVDGALLPWEVMPSLKLHEVVKYHTETAAPTPMLTNMVFVLAMNRRRYDGLPPELKQVIDANSGAETSAWGGRILDEGRDAARKLARERGNTIEALPADEAERWQQASAKIVGEWVKETHCEGVQRTGHARRAPRHTGQAGALRTRR